MRGADPKFLTDSTDSSSAEDGDSCTHSSSEEDSTEHESNTELNDSQNSASNEINACLEALIEESAKTDCAYIICDALVKAFSFGR